MHALLFHHILFNFGGVAGEETWCSAIPSACRMACPQLEQHEWRDRMLLGCHYMCPHVGQLAHMAEQEGQDADTYSFSEPSS